MEDCIMKKILYLMCSSFLLLFLFSCNVKTEKYVIQYHTVDETIVSVEYEENTTINKDDCPNPGEKQGYEADTWYLDDTYSSPVTFPYIVTKNGDFYMKWNPIVTTEEITITFQIEGKSDRIQIQKGTLLPTTETPKKEGFDFKGWSTDPNTFTKFDVTTPITTDLTLYAFFESKPIYHTVSLKVDNIEWKSQSVLHETTVTLDTPTKEGHPFKGWSTDPNTFTKFDVTTPITTDLTLYAFFEDETIHHNVSFVVDDADYDSQSILHGNTATKPTDPTKEGYYFGGWYLDNEKFDFTTKILDDITLVGKYFQSSLSITTVSGYEEGFYVELPKQPSTELANYSFYYRASGETSFTPIDKELVREKDNILRCDMVGLKAGNYEVKVSLQTTETLESIRDVRVDEQDRSGYAHFQNQNGIGAYNNDGTLKSNAIVVYVNDQNKNTVQATIGGKTYTGLADIIKNCTDSNYSLDIRIIGEIKTTQWNVKKHGTGNTIDRQKSLDSAFNYEGTSSRWNNTISSNSSRLSAEEILALGINSMSNDLAKGITQLNGLTSHATRSKKTTTKDGYTFNEYDSYWNMLDVLAGQNITIEGIGTDAAIFQWGFAFKKCNSIEVKNLRFYNYTEDAVGFEGGSSDIDYGNYWLHHCTFDIGLNNWDICLEADKGDGDGSSDFKYCHNVTISYCRYNKTHKTNLIGSGDSALQYNFTIHHNYYNNCGSRLPLLRQANVHFYNNYYYKTTGYCSSVRANAYAFFENCYYESAKNPFDTVKSSLGAGLIKAIGCEFVSCSTSKNSSSDTYTKENTTTDRNAKVSSTCKPDGSTDYNNFDTNPNLFYYDTVNKKSNVSYLTDAATAKSDCTHNAGVLSSSYRTNGSTNTPSEEPVTPPQDTTKWTEKVNETFTSSKTVTEVDKAPTTPGLYYYYTITKANTTTSSATSETNNMNIANGKLNITDTTDTDTTFGFYMFEETYQTGKIRISIDFEPASVNGKWTMIHFLSENGNIGIRSDENRYLSYTVGQTTQNILDSAYTAKTTYTIVLTIDYTNQTATVSINDNEVSITGFDFKSINGIMFQTASAARSFSVDNIKIETA